MIDSECNNANEKLAINIQLEQKTKELEKDNWMQNKGSYNEGKMQMVQWRWKNSKYFLSLAKRH